MPELEPEVAEKVNMFEITFEGGNITFMIQTHTTGLENYRLEVDSDEYVLAEGGDGDGVPAFLAEFIEAYPPINIPIEDIRA